MELAKLFTFKQKRPPTPFHFIITDNHYIDAICNIKKDGKRKQNLFGETRVNEMESKCTFITSPVEEFL